MSNYNTFVSKYKLTPKSCQRGVYLKKMENSTNMTEQDPNTIVYLNQYGKRPKTFTDEVCNTLRELKDECSKNSKGYCTLGDIQKKDIKNKGFIKNTWIHYTKWHGENIFNVKKDPTLRNQKKMDKEIEGYWIF
jgi:hypothetical protein